jgi:hypothetical protein
MVFVLIVFVFQKHINSIYRFVTPIRYDHRAYRGTYLNRFRPAGYHRRLGAVCPLLTLVTVNPEQGNSSR